MRYKVKHLVKMLLDAGFTCKTERGKGSHRMFYFPGMKPVVIPHKDNDDAKPYMEKQVFKAIQAAKGAGE